MLKRKETNNVLIQL